jgi:isopentenyl diphosphate isomerase/L-lactate dehydrogenase-like FMN-dependent dehydrogenase
VSDKTKTFIAQASMKVDGQATPANLLDAAQAKRAAEVETHDQQEAAQFCEDTIEWMRNEVAVRGLTPEQLFFAVSLVTINLRNHFPQEKGGKELFDSVSKKAWEYFQNAK